MACVEIDVYVHSHLIRTDVFPRRDLIHGYASPVWNYSTKAININKIQHNKKNAAINY